MKVNRCRHLFSIGGQILTFIRKFYEGKKSNFGRRVFIFVLPIRNKSPFSGKILTSFKIEGMSFNIHIGNIAETQNRDANHSRWQESKRLGLSVSGHEYWKMDHREKLWWGCCCKKSVKAVMCQKGGTLSLTRARPWTAQWRLSATLRFFADS